MDEARELTDQAKFAMDSGDYEEAVALAERALTRLRGTGDIYEAYASYNAGNSYAELGDCERALPLLERSEQVQGERSEIDAARAKCS
jgi:tetratricopeptide (TPR) repeat protein